MGRDEIQHCMDFRRLEVTCRASEVLEAGTGFCYAKSHLLAALLRANSIPAGFCYQRLSIDGVWPPFSLHGFNAVWLPDFGWYRIDARGNKLEVVGRVHAARRTARFPHTIRRRVRLPRLYSPTRFRKLSKHSRSTTAPMSWPPTCPIWPHRSPLQVRFRTTRVAPLKRD